MDKRKIVLLMLILLFLPLIKANIEYNFNFAIKSGNSELISALVTPASNLNNATSLIDSSILFDIPTLTEIEGMTNYIDYFEDSKLRVFTHYFTNRLVQYFYFLYGSNNVGLGEFRNYDAMADSGAIAYDMLFMSGAMADENITDNSFYIQDLYLDKYYHAYSNGNITLKKGSYTSITLTEVYLILMDNNEITFNQKWEDRTNNFTENFRFNRMLIYYNLSEPVIYQRLGVYEITLNTGEDISLNNSLPEVNMTTSDNEYTYCVNSSDNAITINLNYSSYDNEGDTIYYSLGVNEYDTLYYSSNFGFADCESKDIYTDNFNNADYSLFGKFVNYSYNAMYKGVEFRYYNTSQGCYIFLNESQFTDTLYDKDLRFMINDFDISTDIYFKLKYNDYNSNLTLAFNNYNYNLFNLITFNRIGNNSIILDYEGNIISNTTITDITAFQQYKIEQRRLSNEIRLIQCINSCENEVILGDFDNFISNDYLMFIHFWLRNNTVSLDDLSFSKNLVSGNFSIFPTYSINLEGITSQKIELYYTDDVHLDSEYDSTYFYITTINEEFCYNADLETNDDLFNYENKDNLTGIPLLFNQLLYLIRFPYRIAKTYNFLFAFQLAGVFIVVLGSANLYIKGFIQTFKSVLITSWLLGALFQLMLMYITGFFVIQCLGVGLALVQAIKNEG